jgi:putative ABC transport system permease protein
MTLLQDLRYGTRTLAKNPGFTAVAVVTLALGIGVNTAIFQLLDAVRLRTLPVKNPQELAVVRVANMDWFVGRGIGRDFRITYAQWDQMRRHQQAFAGMLAWSPSRFNLAPTGEARYAQGIFVSGDFFNVLGVGPLLGRVFTPADDQPGCGSSGVIISHSFWQREYGGEASAIGSKLIFASSRAWFGSPFCESA